MKLIGINIFHWHYGSRGGGYIMAHRGGRGDTGVFVCVWVWVRVCVCVCANVHCACVYENFHFKVLYLIMNSKEQRYIQ